MANIAIIGGTGLYDPRILENIREEEVNTRQGSSRAKRWLSFPGMAANIPFPPTLSITGPIPGR